MHQEEAKGCSYLVLWLDCDREGENICFEVMQNVVPNLKKLAGEQQARSLREHTALLCAPPPQH